MFCSQRNVSFEETGARWYQMNFVSFSERLQNPLAVSLMEEVQRGWQRVSESMSLDLERVRLKRH